MEVIKKITIIAVLVASSAMFSFANGQVEGLSDEGYQSTEAEREEAYNQRRKRLSELESLRFESCLEAETMINKRRKLLMAQESKKMPSATQLTMHAQILTAWVTYYQTICEDRLVYRTMFDN